MPLTVPSMDFANGLRQGAEFKVGQMDQRSESGSGWDLPCRWHRRSVCLGIRTAAEERRWGSTSPTAKRKGLWTWSCREQ